MKIRLLLALVCCWSVAPGVLAQAPAKGGEKKAPPARSPGDIARDEFNKVRNEPGGKFDQARFDRVIQPGLAYLQQYPTHWGVPEAIRNLVGWSDRIDKAQSALKSAYLSQLRYNLLNARYKEGLSDDAKAALAALDVAVADAELRLAPTGAALNDLREKINGLAETPRTGRYLADREQSYFQIVNVLRGAEAGEAHLNKLTESKERGVVDMAKRELNLVALRKEPVTWKLTGIDGKQFDFAANRGKVIAIYFWSMANRNIGNDLNTVQQVQSDYRKKGVELVTVSFDKPEDREKVQKFMKENGVKCLVHFDGTGNKNEFAAKLNFTTTPKLAVFDQKGTLRFHDLQVNHFGPAVKQLTDPPKKK